MPKENVRGDVVKAQEFLRRLVLSPGNQELLDIASRDSTELLAAMEDVDWDQIINEKTAEKVDLEWIGRVYDALARPFVSEEDAALYEALYKVRETDERLIGEAFECLLQNVSSPTRNFPAYFASLPVAPESRQRELSSSPAVQASPTARRLIPWGITPMTIFSATEAVGLLVDRKIRRRKFSDNEPVILTRGSSQGVPEKPGFNVCSHRAAAREIHLMSRCTEQTASHILDWTIDAAQSTPLLYKGLQAQARLEGVALRLSVDQPEDLRERWGAPKSVVAGAAASVASAFMRVFNRVGEGT